MKQFLRNLIGLAAIVLVVGSMHAEVIELGSGDAFTQALQDQKRLAVVIIDNTKLEAEDQPGLDDLHKDLEQLSEDEVYKLSKIGFATIDIQNIPNDKRTDLTTALGGAFEEPATLLLFENGKVLMDDNEALSEDDLLDYIDDDDLDDINALIYEAWEIPIKYQLRKRELADNGRTLSEQQKEELAAQRARIAQQAQEATQPVPIQEEVSVVTQQPRYVRYPYHGGFSYPGYPRWRRRFWRRRGPWFGGSWSFGRGWRGGRRRGGDGRGPRAGGGRGPGAGPGAGRGAGAGGGRGPRAGGGGRPQR